MRGLRWLYALCAGLMIFILGVFFWSREPIQPLAPSPKPTQTKVLLAPIKSQNTWVDIEKPVCKAKTCARIHIQTLKTDQAWLNTWVNQNIATVIQEQLKQKVEPLTLQSALDQYVKQSRQWQAQYSRNRPYELDISTKLIYQRNQYVLLRTVLNAKQEELTIKNRSYLHVADREQKKPIILKEMIQPQQFNQFSAWVQTAYQKWLNEQPQEVQKEAPKQLDWQDADWFFDQEGIGLHYRGNQISEHADQFDLYLSSDQTKAVLQTQIYQKMF